MKTQGLTIPFAGAVMSTALAVIASEALGIEATEPQEGAYERLAERVLAYRVIPERIPEKMRDRSAPTGLTTDFPAERQTTLIENVAPGLFRSIDTVPGWLIRHDSPGGTECL